MPFPVLLAMGVGTALSAASNYGQAKNAALLQELNNKNAREAGDVKQNIIGLNIVKAHEDFINADANIDIALMHARSEAVVAAAAAGTSGLSVDDQILDIERNAARAEKNELENLFDSISNLEMSRLGVESEVRARSNPVTNPSFAREAAVAGTSYLTSYALTKAGST